jgi:diguanylate cyclase (GGDEF)-like protein
MIKAEKIRKAIESLTTQGIEVTGSFGVAQLNENIQRYEDLLKNADTALYIAKEEGRNRVIMFKEVSDETAV